MYEMRARSNKETDLLLYGTISQWDEVRASEFVKAINHAKDQGYVIINLRINSPGGSIFEGLAIATKIRMMDELTINAYIDGLAASMASVIACSCDKTFIAKGARMMIHQGKGGVWGSARQIRDYADLLDSLNKTLADIYNKKTGKEKDWIIKNWMAEGKDTWFTEDEAKRDSLADEVVEGKVKPLHKEAATFYEMAAHYEQFFDTTKNAMDKETKDKLIKVLALKADATDAEILAAVEAKNAAPAKEEKKEDKTAAGDGKKELVDGVVALAKERGLPEDKAEAFRKIAELDMKAAMTLLPSEKKEEVKETKTAASINDLLEAFKKGGTTNGGSTDRASWTYDEWSKNDPKALLALAKDKPAEFSKLFEASFGYAPTDADIKLVLN